MARFLDGTLTGVSAGNHFTVSKTANDLWLMKLPEEP